MCASGETSALLHDAAVKRENAATARLREAVDWFDVSCIFDRCDSENYKKYWTKSQDVKSTFTDTPETIGRSPLYLAVRKNRATSL